MEDSDCLTCKFIIMDLDSVLLKCSKDRPEFMDSCPLYEMDEGLWSSEKAMKELTNLWKDEYKT